ncbi:hypothetical protein P9112_013154 [Eukaryota sp. TZLM1-RC]
MPVDEHELPTIRKYETTEVASPRTVSKIKHWESRRHHGVIPKESPAALIESRSAKLHKGHGSKRCTKSDLAAFKRFLQEEESDLLSKLDI